MPDVLQVSNAETNTYWEKELSAEETSNMQIYLLSRYGTVGILQAAIKPVRTNNVTNFSIDYFLPTTINHAIKVQEVAEKIFAVLTALVFDMCTLPFRIMTCLPRAISNSWPEDNLLYKYLKINNVSNALLESGHVRVKLIWDCQFGGKHWVEKNINFMEVPIYDDAHYHSDDICSRCLDIELSEV